MVVGRCSQKALSISDVSPAAADVLRAVGSICELSLPPDCIFILDEVSAASPLPVRRMK